MLTNEFDFLKLIKFCCLLIFTGHGVAFVIASSDLNVVFPNGDFVGKLFGVALLIFSLPLLLPISIIKKLNLQFLFFVPFIVLAVTTFSSFVSSGCVPEQIVEHSSKLLTPLLLIHLISVKCINMKKALFLAKIIIALTFFGHGMFALGVNYVPESFIGMTTSILGLEIGESLFFLKVIGMLDILFAFLIFSKIHIESAFVYLIIWGTLTASARLAYGILIYDGSVVDLVYWASNMIFRLPNGLIPFLVLRYINAFPQGAIRAKA